MGLHRRQFVIAPHPVMTDAGWMAVRLAPSLHLSHCPSLPRVSACDLDHTTWHLLGLAVQTDAQRGDPVEEIARSRTDHVDERLYETWAGRWVLVGADRLHMDASGLLGCFYSAPETTAGPSACTYVSSSAALLGDLTGSEPSNRRIEHIRHGRMDWYPPPVSRYRSIRRLLPSQVMTLSTGSLLPRRLLPDPPPEHRYDVILGHLQERLISTLQRAVRRGQTVWVPLSAGYDSRLVLALALAAKIPVATYTMRKVNRWRPPAPGEPSTSLVSHADMTLPPRIADAVGVPHRWIPKGRLERSALEIFDRHTGGHTLENDRVYYSHGQWDWAGPADLILRGGAFEVGHCFYWSRFPQGLPLGMPPRADEIVAGFGLRDDSLHAQGIRLWSNWASERAPARIDWRDRLYIEQRIAGWLSALEQALDLTQTERFYVVNSASMFALLTALPESTRLARTHHVDLIDRLAPRLLRFPFNPPDPLHRRVARYTVTRAVKAAGRLTHFPPASR
jgi:hypothetical protein